jgi:hypothetical protein
VVSLRTVFEQSERLTAQVIVRVVDDPVVAEVLFRAGRFGALGLKRIAKVRGGLVHAFALPSERDVRSLSGEIATLRSALAEVEAKLAEAKEDI